MQNTLAYITNKYHINIGRQYFIDIPQMVGSADLVKLFAELKFTKGAEVGVDRGLFSEFMMKHIPNLHLYGIDSWTNEVYEEGNPYKEPETYFNECYEESMRRLQPYIDAKTYTVIRKFSMDALPYFDDNSLDFVYIDANHDFLNVIQDIQYWLRKVKPGGILSGHDYVFYSTGKLNHVKRAVQAYAMCYHLFPIFAVMYNGHGMKRDRYRSWFYVKSNNN